MARFDVNCSILFTELPILQRPAAALVSQLVASLRAQGHGSLDHSALLLLEEQLSGRRSG